MKCKIAGCSKDIKYKTDQVCQMHYFRKMRNGSYDLKRSRKYRIQNPAGYQKLYEPEHALANSDGYVYEHRFVYFESVSKKLSKCALCDAYIDWANAHIDHIDEDVTNNKKENLRALCRPCNVFRGHHETSMGKMFLTVSGVTMTPTAWAREPNVKVSGSTIRRRKLRGLSDYESVYGKKVTHKTTSPPKRLIKYEMKRIN